MTDSKLRALASTIYDRCVECVGPYPTEEPEETIPWIESLLDAASCHECGNMGGIKIRHGICEVKEARTKALEEAAKVADSCFTYSMFGRKVAAKIRRLKDSCQCARREHEPGCPRGRP